MARTRRSEAAPAGRHGRPGSPRVRLFVALDLSPAERSALADWRDEAIAGREDLRPVREEALHVTLVFLGYQPESDVARIADVALGALEGLAAARLRPLGVVPVPRRGPRLFALDLEDEGGGAAAVQAAAEGALAAARLHRPEKRAFWPHVTLARVKRGRTAAALDAPPAPLGTFPAGEVVLYRSVLRREGAQYESLARFPLSGAGV